MDYRSTQGGLSTILKSLATILQRPSPDSSPYVPFCFPQPTYSLATLVPLPYQQPTATTLDWFFDESTNDQLLKNVSTAYDSRWDNRLIVPLMPRHANSYYLEPFHGLTLAFKDTVLQMLPQLVLRAAQNTQLEK